MSCWVKAGLDFLEIYDAILIAIKSKKGLLNNVLSVGREITQNSAHEFFEIDDTITVVIEYGENLISLWPITPYSVVIEGLAELTKIESTTAI